MAAFIEIKSEKYNINIPLNKRITYLRGDSGVGKTAMLELIKVYKYCGNCLVELNKPDKYKILIVTSSEELAVVKYEKHAIIIADDVLGTEKAEFAETVCRYLNKNDLYLLIINRVDIQPDQNSQKTSYFPKSSILWVTKDSDGINHKVFPVVRNDVFEYIKEDCIPDENQ